MYIIKTLENTSIRLIHKSFIDAFSDYQIKMKMPLEKFNQMLIRRGYVSEISVGAFRDDKLIGFILNGIRIFEGKLTVYDLGTGVLKEYRRQGIINNLFSYTKKLIKNIKAEQYLLEVIKTNDSALELYKNNNFKIRRELECFKMNKTDIKLDIKYETKHLDNLDFKKVIDFWDFIPSWQNSIDSINSTAISFLNSVVEIDNKIVGYGIIDKLSGDIAQIAVDKKFRRKGIGTSIMADLANNTESSTITLLNIDKQAKSILNFLEALGLNNYISQYEMTLTLLE
ncbi:GNAT family N-acetyltransferase [Microaceticoccus formicicus]|uniref:GNAT family N-acetyltransferase n=1 Tax=Microaceticoccus formicicus TaxID=3118105 RepID=UPI003CD01735|nr:GNAT family N-acetyltransferase [Peptoniphilaceae bacterium AMB_02]